MTGQELGSLLLGLLVGIPIGAGLVVSLRSRPRGAPQVRVTVSPDAIPRRRAATLADDARAGVVPPARGGPADHGSTDPGSGSIPAPARTPVLSTPAPSLAFALAGQPGAGNAARLVAVPMGAGVDPLLDALRGSGSRASTALLERTAPTAADVDDAPRDAGADVDGRAAAATAADTAARPALSGPCAELRVVAEERCEVAARARLERERAHDTLRAAQRSYDDHLARAEDAARAADARTVRAAKDEAQRAFRNARASARTTEAVDTAARDWLLEVNRINQEARTAATTALREQEAARALAASLDRLTVEADAARIAAEAADEACLGARQAAADCEEADQPVSATMPPVPSAAPATPWLDEAATDDEPARALQAGTAPTIFRLLQGDRDSLVAIVDRLADDDPDQRRRWQVAISDLVDAILATAIEGAALEFPEDHPFWGPFTTAQSRDIVAALSSLGYRFDGLGGWQDGRVPSQRDLSLALGYAGLDPMRMRRWPNEAEMAELFRTIRVAAPEYLAVAAADLTLGELVTMLGPRADGLTDIWNEWGRIRPLLLEER